MVAGLFYLIEILSVMLVVAFMMTQVVMPLLADKPMFPSFRKNTGEAADSNDDSPDPGEHDNEGDSTK